MSPLCFNVSLENRDTDINEFPISFYQDRDTIIDHSSDINKHVLQIHSCFDIPDKNKKDISECPEIIYDDCFNIEDVDSSPSLLNPHLPNQFILENEEKLNIEIVPIHSHFQTTNHLHDFNIQEPIPIYEYYDDEALIPIHSHDYLSNSQVGIGVHSNCIILANSCEEEIISNQSRLCCNSSCNNNVNYDLILLLFLHLFCLISDLFCVFIF